VQTEELDYPQTNPDAGSGYHSPLPESSPLSSCSANFHDRYPGHLTAEQQQKLDEFRQQLVDAGYTERLDTPSLVPSLFSAIGHLLTCQQCRFLRARKYDVQKAFIMFTDCEQWRTDFGVDEISKTFVFTENPLVTVYYPRYYHKNDKVCLSRVPFLGVEADFAGRPTGVH
jgi:hypothetical protein